MFVNIVLFATWLVIVEGWVARHFPGATGALLAIPVFSPLFIRVVDYLDGKEQREQTENRVKAFVKRCLNFRGIILLYVGFGIVSMTFTTLTIAPNLNGKQSDVKLTSLSGSQIIESLKLKSDKPTNIRLWFNPLANQYRLSVSGYVSNIISIKPFSGTLIVPDRDLVRIPTVLFRPLFRASELLAKRGKLEVFRSDDNKTYSKIGEALGTHAWYAGPRRQQPTEMRSGWRLEATLENLDAKSLAALLIKWRKPKRLAIENELKEIEPGQIICALVTNVDGKRYFAGGAIRIERTDYLDLPITDFIKEDTSNEMEAISGDSVAVCNKLYQGAS